MTERRKRMENFLGTAVHVEIDRPLGFRHGDLVYPVNYGFLPGIPGGDGEDQDAYVLGIEHPLAAFDGEVIGAILRKDDREDKLIVAPAGHRLHQAQIAEAVHFVEQYFDSHVISLFYKSCGILPWRQTEGRREYLMVYESFSQCWSLPKGHMEPGETEVQTALRELLEETGLTATPDTSYRAVIEYPVFSRAVKQVVFFPGQVSGTPKHRDGEIEMFRWVSAGELSDYLFPDTFAAIAPLLEDA